MATLGGRQIIWYSQFKAIKVLATECGAEKTEVLRTNDIRVQNFRCTDGLGTLSSSGFGVLTIPRRSIVRLAGETSILPHVQNKISGYSHANFGLNKNRILLIFAQIT